MAGIKVGVPTSIILCVQFLAFATLPIQPMHMNIDCQIVRE